MSRTISISSAPHCSDRSEPGNVVERGKGTRLEQLKPEQAPGGAGTDRLLDAEAGPSSELDNVPRRTNA
jgi:hypothetical protein